MNNIRKVLNLPVMCAMYSGFIILWYLSWLFIGDAMWWLVLLNRVAVYLFVPALFLIAGVLLTRRMKPSFTLIFPVVIFVLLYHPYFIPRPAKSVDEYAALKVMTYNVLFSNTDYDAIANVVLTHTPDLVALQEVQPAMMSPLKERLKDDYHFVLMGTPNDFGTTAVFSRHPFVDSQVLDLQSDRPAVIVKTVIRDQDVTFAAVHLLAYNLWWTKLKDIPATVKERTISQNRQAEIVLQEINDDGGIVIIGCDCNSYETSSSYRVLDGIMENASHEVGLNFPFGSLSGARQDVSLKHIDYIWYAGDIDPRRAYKILDGGGSDHLPVLVIFEMN